MHMRKWFLESSNLDAKEARITQVHGSTQEVLKGRGSHHNSKPAPVQFGDAKEREQSWDDL